VFGLRLSELQYALEAEGLEISPSDEGLELQDGSVSFYSHDFDGDLEVGLDAVLMRFT